MEMGQIVSSIIISIIAALGGYLASRSSARASVKNIATSSRVEMEKEAYERARKLDTETIQRQDAEIDELRENQKMINADVKMVNQENDRLHRENTVILEDNTRLRIEVRRLRARVVRLERGLAPDDTGPIYEREEDVHPHVRGTDTNPMMREILENGRSREEDDF